MFFLNRHISIMALILLCTVPENLRLVSNIYDAYKDIDLNLIPDIDTRDVVRSTQIFSDELFTKQITSSTQAKLRFNMANIDEEIKEYIQESIENEFFSEAQQEDYILYFAVMGSNKVFRKRMAYLNDAWEDLNQSSLGEIMKNAKLYMEAVADLSRDSEELAKNTEDAKEYIIDTKNEEVSYGLDKIHEEILKSNDNRVRTNTYMDNITNGGFAPEQLYAIGGISGGGKSLWLMNMAEEASIAMKREDFKIPNGMTPAILYVNLEMSKAQLLERRVEFYEGDFSYILHGNDDGTTLQQRMTELLRSKGSNIPVIYLTEDSTNRTFTINQLRTAIQRYERLGFKIVAFFSDYLDKFNFDANSAPSERERDEPITLKAYDHKAIAKEFKIPVITGFQLNTAAEEGLKGKLKRARYEDILKIANSSMIGKARSLTNVPDMILFGYRYAVGSPEDIGGQRFYFALLVDKDRNGKAKYVPRKDLPTGEEGQKKYTNRKDDGRVYYILKIKSFRDEATGVYFHKTRLGNDYASTIKAFEDSSDTYSVLDSDDEDIPSELLNE